MNVDEETLSVWVVVEVPRTNTAPPDTSWRPAARLAVQRTKKKKKRDHASEGKHSTRTHPRTQRTHAHAHAVLATSEFVGYQSTTETCSS